MLSNLSTCVDEAFSVGLEALQAAVHIYTSSSELDGDHLSRCYHSLVQLVVRKEEIAGKSEDGEGWSLFNQILDLLDSKAKVRFYVCGIHSYTECIVTLNV